MQRRSFLLSSIAGLCLKVRAASASDDPWKNGELLEPADFAKRVISQPTGYSLFYVGFPILYRGAHIKGAQLAGPCSKPEGLRKLRQLAQGLPGDREVVLYCGCCPFDQCPNIRPAYLAVHELGLSHLKVLHIANSLHTDWVTKGYPTQKAGHA